MNENQPNQRQIKQLSQIINNCTQASVYFSNNRINAANAILTEVLRDLQNLKYNLNYNQDQDQVDLNMVADTDLLNIFNPSSNPNPNYNVNCIGNGNVYIPSISDLIVSSNSNGANSIYKDRDFEADCVSNPSNNRYPHANRAILNEYRLGNLNEYPADLNVNISTLTEYPPGNKNFKVIGMPNTSMKSMKSTQIVDHGLLEAAFYDLLVQVLDSVDICDSTGAKVHHHAKYPRPRLSDRGKSTLAIKLRHNPLLGLFIAKVKGLFEEKAIAIPQDFDLYLKSFLLNHPFATTHVGNKRYRCNGHTVVIFHVQRDEELHKWWFQKVEAGFWADQEVPVAKGGQHYTFAPRISDPRAVISNWTLTYIGHLPNWLRVHQNSLIGLAPTGLSGRWEIILVGQYEKHPKHIFRQTVTIYLEP